MPILESILTLAQNHQTRTLQSVDHSLQLPEYSPQSRQGPLVSRLLQMPVEGLAMSPMNVQMKLTSSFGK